ncbi:PucR family transcriptional regulator [Kutzneria albida]|uniref:Transcription regulator CdaR n=1 Tax=Kutzneria albida DSM 43870 TaxID=1449976 RepID=W5W687_9PSEU|nr:helix-turn-helix domain-containing protein [Kutzneria albida]AHH96275.1 transcription regulator CdaR [Kutzneria albida DSM 43870]
MTDHKAHLTINGTVLYRWLLTERRRLAQRLVRQFGREIPAYQRLPDSELINISRATETNLQVFAQSLRDRTSPDLADLAGPITTSAAQRAGEGFPLDAVMAAYSTGMLETWRAMVTDARPEDFADVLACTELVLGYIQRACTAVAAAYLEERRRMDSDEQHRRYTLFSALVRGEPPEGPAARAGIQLPERYLVLSLTFEQHTDERVAGVGAAMAAQRKVYRATEVLRRSAGDGVLSLLDPTGGTVLLPVTGTDWSALVAEVGAATGVPVRAAGVLAEPAQVAPATQQTAEMLELVVALGRPPGLYQLADVLLEYQLTRPSAARDELGRLLAPLEQHPDLLSTVETYLRLGLDRRRTATTLHLHPNTIDYRVRRAVALTGLDPADPQQLQQIGAALVIRRLGQRARAARR